MSETKLLLCLASLVVGCGALAVFIFWRLFLRGQFRTRRWSMKIPIIFAAYHAAWSAISLISFATSKDYLFPLNPVYLFVLQNASFFERGLTYFSFLHIHSPMVSVIFLMSYMFIVPAVLWVLLGIGLGLCLDLADKVKKNTAS